MKKVIVLGAGGRFGRAVTKAFSKAGWSVTAMLRKPRDIEPKHIVNIIIGDALNLQELADACSGHSVIVNATNPPYELWQEMLPVLTRNIISVAKENSATVLIPGNVYNYGNELPDVLHETTPHIGNTRKGKLRIEMESAYRAAIHEGVRTIVLRGGDFMDGRDTGNWFESYIAKNARKGKLVYPGSPDTVHAWAYLPDMARAMVSLSEKRESFAGFVEFGFEGYSLTGHQLAELIEHTLEHKIRITRFPWFLVKILSIFSKHIREVLEMRYIWERPHQIDGSQLKRMLPEFQSTPVERAMHKMFRPQECTVGKTSDSKSQAGNQIPA